MTKETKIVLVLFLTIVFSISAFFLYPWWKIQREAAYHSCIGSVANAIQKLDAIDDLVADNKEWKVLSDEESDFLMSRIQAGDCGGFDNPTLDVWSNRINIALRNSPNYPNIIVWSNGEDAISGTKDDLVIPYGQAVPK